MRYIYTSHWKARDSRVFRLCGVLLASSGEVTPYFPNEDDADDLAEWTEQISALRDAGESFSPMHWLRQIADSGNGITEEFSTIREIEAPGPGEASKAAYAQVVKEHGRDTRLYQEAVAGERTEVSDPLAGIWR